MEGLNVIFYSLDKLSLVLSDSTSDVRTHKQSIEPGEDPEHLISILCCSKLISQTSCDPCFHSVNALIIPDQQGQNMCLKKQCNGVVNTKTQTFKSNTLNIWVIFSLLHNTETALSQYTSRKMTRYTVQAEYQFIINTKFTNLLMAASQASEPSFDTSSPSTSLTFSYARFTS